MKVKRFYAFLLLVLTALSANVVMAQQMALPIDEAVRIGKLDNGLTYYIRHNNYPEHRADFYIAQRVGAMQEEDSQNGLAHFLEHMAFNGSEHFNGEGHGIIDFIQSIGLNFGADVNAFTSFTRTVYLVTNVPTARQSVLDSCLLVLKDWSHGLLLTDEEIDKERGVIHEEWRLGRDANERMTNRQRDNLFAGSKYAKRDVIGSMDVVDYFPYQVLRDYYDKWYRPDNQALVIVGDVDVDYTEAKIREMFKDIPAPGPDAAQVETYPVPDNDEPIVVIEKDVEQQFSVVQLVFKHDIIEKEMKGDVNYLVLDYMKDMMSSMLNQRFQEKVQDPDCPFLQAYGFDTSYMGANTKDAFYLTVVPKEGMIEAATEVGLIETLRAARFGFTATEYERAKESYMSRLDRQYNERDKVHNRTYAQRIYTHFLENEPMMSVEQNYELMKMIVPNIPVEAINQVLPELINTDGKNLVVVNYNQEKEGAVYPHKEGLMGAITAAENAEIEAYVDNVKQEPLIAKLPKKGKIVKETYNETLGYKDLELSNGVHVQLKPTTYKQDEIFMLARQRGGNSLYGEEDWANCEMFDYAIESSGLGGFNSIELRKALAGKRVSLSQTMSTYEDYINGSSSVKDLETLFQLLYLQFTDVTRDDKSYNSLVNQIEISLKNKDLDPDNVFSDSLSYIMDNYSWRSKPYKLEDMKNLSYDRILEIGKERTANAAGYDFMFVGSFDEAVIRPLIEQYIASLPAKKGAKSNWVNVDNTPMGQTIKHFSRKMETPKTTMFINWFNTEIPHNLENSIKAQLLGKVLNRINRDKIREDAGAAYSISTYGQNYKSGDNTMTSLTAYAPLKPEFTDMAIQIVNEEMLKACENIDAASLEDFKKAMIKDHETQLKENSYWYTIISTYATRGLDMCTGYEDFVNAQTPETIADFARQILSAGNKIEVVMTPAE
ncbi:MAG: insulinase family protein [Muribaculaceae bacterium]|nr:insulinase family protein [Muribaculaceae bacterium]